MQRFGIYQDSHFAYVRAFYVQPLLALQCVVLMPSIQNDQGNLEWGDAEVTGAKRRRDVSACQDGCHRPMAPR